MSVKDVIKNSVLAGFESDIGIIQIVMSLGVTVALALVIYAVYRLSCDSNFYSRDFNKTMVSMSVITAGIVLAMQSNIVISLGMVGALSIVRFRNAVKNPLDLLFLFWSISVGIMCGAGVYQVALAVSAAVIVLVFGLDVIHSPRAPYILVVNISRTDAEQTLLDAVKPYVKKMHVRTRNLSATGANYVIEVSTRQEQMLLESCNAVSGVLNLSLVSHDGEVRY